MKDWCHQPRLEWVATVSKQPSSSWYPFHQVRNPRVSQNICIMCCPTIFAYDVDESEEKWKGGILTLYFLSVIKKISTWIITETWSLMWCFIADYWYNVVMQDNQFFIIYLLVSYQCRRRRRL
jgi:hypothetical protein